jgi:hypothetical protein
MGVVLRCLPLISPKPRTFHFLPPTFHIKPYNHLKTNILQSRHKKWTFFPISLAAISVFFVLLPT